MTGKASSIYKLALLVLNQKKTDITCCTKEEQNSICFCGRLSFGFISYSFLFSGFLPSFSFFCYCCCSCLALLEREREKKGIIFFFRVLCASHCDISIVRECIIIIIIYPALHVHILCCSKGEWACTDSKRRRRNN